MALNLLYSGFSRRIGLNDLDPAIYAFWYAAVRHSDEFCQKIADVAISIDQWHRQQEIWSNPADNSLMDVGFAAFFLNRTNRSGIIEGAGPIGGYNQIGSYKLDVRFNKSALIRSISLLGAARDNIEVTNDDALIYLETHLNESNFVYLDPPYYVRGRKLYRNFYTHDDHVAIADLMKNSSSPWLVSYDDVPQIREIYDWACPLEVKILYTAGKAALGSEVLYLSTGINGHHVAA